MLFQLSYSGAFSWYGNLPVLSGHGPSDVVVTLGNMEHPKAIGDRSTLAIMLALRGAGFALYAPFGENTRCDLIVDDGMRLSRCKGRATHASPARL
jgi:PD-(D/E)XK endonuclease